MSNKVYEIGGSADVFIKLKMPITINNLSYQPNETYTILKDVVVDLDYNQNSSNVAAKSPIISAQNAKPSQINIYNVPFTQKICNLIMSLKPQKTYNKTEESICICEDGQIYLPYTPVQNSVFIYDKQHNRLSDFEIEGDYIICDNFVDNEQYRVIYQRTINVNLFGLEVPHYPYFSLEIQGKGNNDKISSNMFMLFDSVSLVTVPNMNFTNNGIMNTPLVFDIVYRGQQEPIIGFEE